MQTKAKEEDYLDLIDHLQKENDKLRVENTRLRGRIAELEMKVKRGQHEATA